MKNIKNLIQINNNFPINVDLVTMNYNEKSWHKNTVLILGLEGVASISINEEAYTIGMDDILLINPWTNYMLYSNLEFAYLEITLDLPAVNKSLDGVCFDVNSTFHKDKSKFALLKNAIFDLIRANTSYNKGIEYLNYSYSYKIIYILTNKFIASEQNNQEVAKGLGLLQDVIAFIDNNYKNNITLNSISQAFGYTPQYFSSFFKKYMNQNFQSYYDDFRISKTIKDLIDSDMSIEEIATSYGFSDYRSYIRAFKNKYDATPSDFRKRKINYEGNDNVSLLGFSNKYYLNKVYERIDNSNLNHKDNVISLSTSFLAKGTTIKKTFLNVISTNQASDLLIDDIRFIIKRIKAQINYKYIRMSNPFSDLLYVYQRNNNQTSYSFTYLDKIFDYIYSLGLKPFIELSYVPYDLAYSPNGKHKGGIIYSKPNDILEWTKLVSMFINHYIKKYGTEEVFSWPFSIWSTPDSANGVSGFKDELEFFEFYNTTYKAIKDISPRLQVGSPSLMPFSSFSLAWDNRYLKYSLDNNCYPDFLNVHYFSNDFDAVYNGNMIERLSDDSNSFSYFIKKIKEPSFYRNERIYLTEWNFTSSKRNLLNDTLYSSAYLTKGIIENMDLLESFSFGVISDLTEENQILKDEFYGNYGLFTKNSVSKASFYSLCALAKLTGTVLAKGEGYYITKDLRGIQIIIYNYEHFNNLYADGEVLGISSDNRYAVFNMDSINHYSFTFNDLSFDYARIKTTMISCDSGSGYDIFVRTGESYFEAPNEAKQIDCLSVPKYEVYSKNIINGRLDIKLEANALEVKLVEIFLERHN